MWCLLAWLILPLACFVDGRGNETRSVRSVIHHDEGGVLCEIRTLDIDYEGAEKHNEATACVTTSYASRSQTYLITVPHHVKIRNGELLFLRGPVQRDNNNTRLITTEATEWDIVSPQRHDDRRLRMSPNRVSLIVRVTYRGRAPSLSASQLQGRIFGRGANRVEHSLRTQLEACSQGQYAIRIPTHADIHGGVLEVTITKSVAGLANSVLTLENLVVAQATRRLGDTLWNRLSHVMIVLPSHEDIRFNGDPYFLAYGYLGGTVTVFRSRWAGSLSVLMHEIGHNLDLSHSGGRGDVYGDMTGYMGYGLDVINGPRMCFNGQKHYATGWYRDRTRHLFQEDLPFAGWLAFFGQVSETAPNEPVLWVLNLPGPERLFLQYNLAKGLNAGTQANRNAVTLTRDNGGLRETSGLQSWWVGTVNSNDPTFRYQVDELHGRLVITLCNARSGSPPKVHLTVHLDSDNDEGNPASCRDDLLPYCDDNLHATFSYNGRPRDCGWLARRVDQSTTIRDAICGDASHAGYRACRETCGACQDHCHDHPSRGYWVNPHLGRKNCKWLSRRLHWQEKLCVVGHDAFRLCPESCNRCD